MCCIPTDSSIRPIETLTFDSELQFGVWNLWYFWFVVIFLFMACTGACAFWRHRRRLLVAEQAALATVSFGTLVPRQRYHCPPSQLSSEASRGSLNRFSYFSTVMASSPSTQEPLGEFPAPPPYSELAAKSSILSRNSSYLRDLPPYSMNTEFFQKQSEHAYGCLGDTCSTGGQFSCRATPDLPTSPPSYSTLVDAVTPPTYTTTPPRDRSSGSLPLSVSTPSIGSGEVLIPECSERQNGVPL